MKRFFYKDTFTTQGKRVDSWFYSYQSVEPGDGRTDTGSGMPMKSVTRKVQIDVRLEKTLRRGEPPCDLVKPTLIVTCQSPRFTFTGTDLEELRAAAWGVLDRTFEIRWEQLLAVKVERESVWPGTGKGFSFSYTRVERGTRNDGLQLQRVEKYTDNHEIKAWPEPYVDGDGTPLVVIPDTRENRESLSRVADLVDDLRRRMRADFGPECFAASIANPAALPYFTNARARARKA